MFVPITSSSAACMRPPSQAWQVLAFAQRTGELLRGHRIRGHGGPVAAGYSDYPLQADRSSEVRRFSFGGVA
eukprot:1272808-Pyramimonas_sp.AAC.1